jgi:glycogen debranching enzyme
MERRVKRLRRPSGDSLDLRLVRQRLQEDLARLKAPEGYLRAGAPRYLSLFGRDSLITAWQTLAIDPRIAEATLRILARFQGKRFGARAEEQPGKILHEHRFDPESQKELPDWDFPYFGSIDSTPLFLILAHEFVRQTGREGPIDDLWTNLEAAYRWMVEYGDKDADGYVEYERTNPRGLLHQGWKDGMEDHLHVTPPAAMVEVQGYAVRAHRAYAALARRRGDHAAADRAEVAGSRLRTALNRDFWMPDLEFFALALSGNKRPRRAVTSNPGHLLLMNAVAEDRVDLLVDRLFREDMWTPYGIRTHAASESDFDPYGYHTGSIWPHDNWFIYKGLRLQGRASEANRIRDALLRAWEELGNIPELYAVVDDHLVDLTRQGSPTAANALQAWSSAGLLDIITGDEGLNP